MDEDNRYAVTVIRKPERRAFALCIQDTITGNWVTDIRNPDENQAERVGSTEELPVAALIPEDMYSAIKGSKPV